MLLPSTPSKVAAAIIYATLFNRSASVHGKMQIDQTTIINEVSRYLMAQLHLLKIRRHRSTYSIVIHTDLWDTLKAAVPSYRPYEDEPTLIKRKYGKTYRGTLAKHDLLHALRWVRMHGREIRQFDIYFPLNEEVAWGIMRDIEKRVKQG